MLLEVVEKTTDSEAVWFLDGFGWKESGDRQGCTPTNVPRHGKSLYFRPISTMGTRTLGVRPSLSLEGKFLQP